MSKSDGYVTQEIVFSIRTEFEIYVCAMAAAAAADQIPCEREKIGATQPEQESKNERRNPSECEHFHVQTLDSIRLNVDCEQ